MGVLLGGSQFQVTAQNTLIPRKDTHVTPSTFPGGRGPAFHGGAGAAFPGGPSLSFPDTPGSTQGIRVRRRVFLVLGLSGLPRPALGPSGPYP